MSDVRRPRVRAVAIFVAVVACIGAAFCACTQYRANGENCLKNDDCLSSLCLAQVCSSPNPTLNGDSYPEDGSTEDAGGGSSSGGDSGKATTDGSADAPADGPAVRDSGRDSALNIDGASDSATEVDSGSDAPDALRSVSHTSRFA